jgi:type I restriction enzyme S subunit
MKQGWEIKTIGNVCKVIAGQSPEGKFYNDNGNGLPFYQGKKEYGEKYIGEPTTWTTKVTKEAEANDILMSVRAPVGPINFATQKICIGRGLAAIRATKLIDKEFLFNFLLKHESEIVGNTGAVFNSINKAQIEAIEIPLPPLPEQQRIVSILDEAFAAIAKAKANAEQNLNNAKELFDVYLHKYYTSKEEGWEEKNLKEVAEYFNGLTYSPKDVSNEGIIVLRSSNVQNDELDFDDIVRVNLTVKEKIIVKDGDILMCSRNGSARLVGKTATIKNLNEEMTFGTFMMIIRSQYNPYLSWFFKSTDFRNQIKGGENTMINQITRYMLDDIVLSFPPIDKQNEIVKKLDALSIEIKKLDTIYNQKINDLEELKKSVLQKAFSGELRVSESGLAGLKDKQDFKNVIV